MCLRCTAGLYSSGTAASSCLPTQCAAGTYASKTGAVDAACDACEAGAFSTATAATSCSRCRPGHFSNATAALECSPCSLGAESRGSYADASGSSVCTSCPAFTSSNVPTAATEASVCRCSAGHVCSYAPRAAVLSLNVARFEAAAVRQEIAAAAGVAVEAVSLRA